MVRLAVSVCALCAWYDRSDWYGTFTEIIFMFAIIIFIFFCFQFSMVSVYFIQFICFFVVLVYSIARSLFLASHLSGIKHLKKINTWRNRVYLPCESRKWFYLWISRISWSLIECRRGIANENTDHTTFTFNALPFDIYCWYETKWTQTHLNRLAFEW